MGKCCPNLVGLHGAAPSKHHQTLSPFADWPHSLYYFASEVQELWGQLPFANFLDGGNAPQLCNNATVI